MNVLMSPEVTVVMMITTLALGLVLFAQGCQERRLA